jgi:hypothetical protein
MFRSIGNTSLLFLLISVLVTACSIETAKTAPNKQLVIVSDYLNEQDTVLFSSFAKEKGVSIEIQTMNIDRIIGLMRNKGDNSGIDVVMVKSLFDIQKLDWLEMLQTIDYSEHLPEEISKYSSWKYNYVGIGIDPYVIAYDERSDHPIKTYNELTSSDFFNFLQENEEPPMLAAIYSKLKKAQANNWIKNYSKRSFAPPLPQDSIANLDSLLTNRSVLTLYSTFHLEKKSAEILKHKTFLYPNEKSTGAFYNVRTIGFIQQAQNYTIAKEFAIYYAQTKSNATLNSALNTLPINSNKQKFRKFTISAHDMIQYYGIVDRVLAKVKE